MDYDGSLHILVENLRFDYPGSDSSALACIDLRLECGSTTAVLGRNGSGKSTLARCLNGLLKPTGGRVVSCGLETSSVEDLPEIRERVAMVFQEPDTQMVGATVEEEVAFGPENLGLPPEDIRERVDRALEMVGISWLSGRQPSRLSEGQKQMVAVAGALAMAPSFLVSDESTSMLDWEARSRVMNLYQELSRKGMGIVHVTHFLDEAAQCDRVVILDGGYVALQGTPGQTLSDPSRARRLGLDPLPVTLVAREIASLGHSLPEGILDVKELISWLGD